MPSRNSINKPKLTAKKPSRPHKKDIKLIASSETTPLTTSSAGKLTSKVISKKRAKKDARNKKYREQYLKKMLETTEGHISMEDTVPSKTQLKKQARLEAIKLQFEQDQPLEEMHYVAGEGTTLGGPGW